VPLSGGFRCIAYTDLDGDGTVAVWFKTATYDPATDGFQGGGILHVDGTGEW
jgi:hypothetical protein